MQRPRRVTLTSSAIDDLEAIREWYADQLVPDVGERLLREVVDRVERLAEFPELGRMVPEFEIPNLREIVHPPFRIVYRLDADHVRVLRVWRSERRLKLPEPDEA